MKFEVPFIKPTLPHWSEIAEDYEEIIKNNWFTNFGPFEAEFRSRAGDYLDNHGVLTTVANATLGLDLSIRALVDKSSSDARDVIMPSFTFAAGANAILSNGLRPVFIDVDHHSWQPSIDEATEYVADNRDDTAGILLCNVFGVGGPEIDSWEELAATYDLPLIIDSAAGFGSRYPNGEHVGARGNCEVFSLHATKPFAVGEGGLVSSRDPEVIGKIRQLQNFGFDTSRQVADIGTNAKLQEINCAIGLRQLKDFKTRLLGRQATLNLYKVGLMEAGYQFQDNDDLSTVAFASVLAPDIPTGNDALARLQKAGVETRRYYAPLHRQKALARRSILYSAFKHTEDIASRIISLPVHDDMNPQYIDRIVTAINK